MEIPGDLTRSEEWGLPIVFHAGTSPRRYAPLDYAHPRHFDRIAIAFPDLEMEKGRERLPTLLIEQGVKAIEEDGAHILILGCTGMMGLAQEVEKGLKERGYEVPVIDPVKAAVKMAEALVDMGLSHSKMTYPYPPEKEIIGYYTFQLGGQIGRF